MGVVGGEDGRAEAGVEEEDSMPHNVLRVLHVAQNKGRVRTAGHNRRD